MNDKIILKTPRLTLREITQADFDALCRILQDQDVMYAYEHAFSDAEVRDWLDRQRRRYADDGFGLWAAVCNATGEMIGQCGLTMQDWDGKRVPEIGYLFCKAFWHQGYATEAARACRQYAFETLHMDAVFSIIRENNDASKRVAQRNGMQKCGSFVKHYYGMDMPHDVYCVRKEDV